MAELFLALRNTIEGFSKVVALKRVLPHLARSQANVAMFLEEARLAAKLDHPNIVRIYELGEVEGRHFISMEYLPGEDLAQILARSAQLSRPIPIDVAMAIVGDVALGLDYAHQLDYGGASLVHRDISPSNIILTYLAAAKIVDFGLAKAVNGVKKTRTGIVRGKLAYFAPEQLRKKELDHRTDIFALGLVLFELLAGRPAFSGDSEAEILTAAARGEVRAVTTDRPDAPPELERILGRALAFEPIDRYPSALDFHHDLIELANHRGSNLSGAMLTHWLTELFGSARAELKLDISRGRDLEKNARELIYHAVEGSNETSSPEPEPQLPRPRALLEFATSLEGHSTQARVFASSELELSARGETRWAMLAVLVLLAASAAAILELAPGAVPLPSAENAPQTILHVESQPEGADIFIADRPIGQKTPADIYGLTTGAPIKLSLHKRGYAAATDTVVLSANGLESYRHALRATAAFLTFTALPQAASVLVDGVPVSAHARLEVEPGPHQVRVERRGEILEQRMLSLTPGEEQEVSLR